MDINYQELQQELKGLCLEFKRKHSWIKVDLEELMSIVNLSYVRALMSYKEEKGELRNWIIFLARRDLLEFLREEWKRRKRFPFEDREIGEILGGWKMFSFLEFTDGMKEQTKQVVMLVLHTPTEIQSAFLTRKSGDPKTVGRKVLAEYLEARGWREKDIKYTFKKIMEALQ